MTGKPTFWLVWRSDGVFPPTYQHTYRDSAVNEAKRLARANPEQTFVVLMAETAFVKHDIAETRFIDEDPEISF